MSRSMTIFLMGAAPLMALVLAILGAATVRANKLGWFLLFMGLAYLIGGPLYVWKRRGEPPARQEERGDRSFWLILPGFILSIFGAPLDFLYLPALLPHVWWMQSAGWFLVGVSVAAHSWARQAIRGQFSGHVQIQPGHRLVQDGPYRFVRHPAYLGYLLMALGVAVGYSSLAACAVVFGLLLPGLVYRIGVEEKMLVGEFGEEYRQYAARTRRLIPGVW